VSRIVTALLDRLKLTNAAGTLINPAVAERQGVVDVFGQVVTGSRDNQIEVHFDDTNWATYVTVTKTGGGDATQHEGHVHFTTGTGTNGRASATTLDTIKYRPMHEVYDGWTAAFSAVGVANSYQRIGLGDSTNAAFVGYENAVFGATWRRNSIDAFTPRSSWDDQLDGSPGSRFTRDGVPEALNPAFTNVYRVRVGLLGSAPLIFEVLSPDQDWVPFLTIKRPNVDSEPTFTNFDLPAFIDVRKTGGGATELEIRTACWAGGTTSGKARLSDAITDRSLAEIVRAVIEGKTPSGGYAKLAVNAAGRLQVTNDSVGTDGAAPPAGTTAVGGTDGTNLQTMRVASDGSPLVQDAFTGGEVLADQAGANGVLDFDFASPVQLVWVRLDGGTVNGRVDPFGTAPASGLGIIAEPGIPVPITRTLSALKVWAPAGSTVSVHGYRY
jgi:hypothetical protein